MISKKQKEKVIELLKQNNSITETSKKTGISRTKVTEIKKDYEKNKNNVDDEDEFFGNIDSDPEIIKLKKELTKEQLKRKIREQTQPFEVEKALKELKKRVDSVEYEYYGNLLIDNTWKCKHCNRRGKVAIQIKCTNCDEESWLGWFPK